MATIIDKHRTLIPLIISIKLYVVADLHRTNKYQKASSGAVLPLPLKITSKAKS